MTEESKKKTEDTSTLQSDSGQASSTSKDGQAEKGKKDDKSSELKDEAVVSDAKDDPLTLQSDSGQASSTSKDGQAGQEEIDLNDEGKPEKKINLMDDDLPDDVKEKLEKNKKERLKASKKKGGRKKKKKQATTVKIGKAFIKATYNNTIVTLTDLQGNVISWASAGIAGFKGPKKSTPYAAQIITKIAVIKAKEEYSLNEVSVFVKGVGTGRESAVRSLNANGLEITSIKDITPIPHNGCRARRPRRV
jgi:small subunit ribosomal protein S11